MKSDLLALLFIVAVSVAAGAPGAHANPAETAKALVDKAIAHYEAVGRAQAIQDFNDPDGAFVDGEFYVIVAEAESGVFKAHPINGALIDNPKLWELKDVNGRYIIREMVAAGKESPQGAWTEYVWTHPETRKLTPKRTYIRRHDGLLFMVGFYTGDNGR